MKQLFIQTLLTLFIVFCILFLFTSMSFWIREGFVLFAIFFLLLLLSMVWPPDSPWSPWWKTTKKVALQIKSLAQITPKDTVYELGSGDAELLLTLAHKFQIKSVGVEIDPLRHYIALFRVQLHQVAQLVTLYKQNMFVVDISPATVVYVYLVPKALERLKQKFLTELKPGTRVISYRYEIPYLPLVKEDKKNKLYVYTVPKKD